MVEDQARASVRLCQIDREEPELASQTQSLEQMAREQERVRNEKRMPLDEINRELTGVENRVRRSVDQARSAAKKVEDGYLRSPE